MELSSGVIKWANPCSFCLFSFFSNTLQKKCRLQQDSNSDRLEIGVTASSFNKKRGHFICKINLKDCFTK